MNFSKVSSMEHQTEQKQFSSKPKNQSKVSDKKLTSELTETNQMLVGTAIVLVASLVLVAEAGGSYCAGPHCGQRGPPAYLRSHPVPQYRAPYGPYHSYAVKPAVYGGPRLYTYRGYARQPRPAPAAAAPVNVHLKAAAYSPYAHAPIVAPITLAIHTGPAAAHDECRGYNCPAPAHTGLHYGLHPVKAVLLTPIVAPVAARPAYPARQSSSYRNNGPEANANAYNSHAALAGPLYRGEAIRPAGYGAGHYYQALESLKSGQHGGGYKPSKPAAGGY